MPPLHTIYRQIIYFLATGFGSGLSPKAPGTIGTLVAVPIYLTFNHLPLLWYLFITLLATIFGFFICHEAAKYQGVHDHPSIVWDEFCGFWITMIAAPKGFAWIIIGFVLFRLFDIWKPGPIRYIDRRIHGGLGIMLDDVLAGIFACLCLQVVAFFINLAIA